MEQDDKPELFTFNVEGRYFVLHPPSGTLFEVDRRSYRFCEYVKKWGLNTAKNKFKEEYSTEELDQIMKDISDDKELMDIFYMRYKPTPLPKDTKRHVYSVVLNTIEQCNFACLYCYGDEGTYHTPNTKMDPQIAKKAIDIVFKNSEDDITIVFFGGEPLLNFRLIEDIVEYSKQKAEDMSKKVRFAVTTNGYLITDKVIEFFIKNKFSITLSIDGPADIHNHNRPLKGGYPSFDIVANNARKMMDNGIRIYARATLLPDQLDRYYEVYMFLREFGFAGIHIEPATVPQGIPPTQSSKLFDEALSKIAHEELKHYKKQGIIYTKFKDILQDIHLGSRRYYSCGASRGYFGISADGGVYPCHRFIGTPEFKLMDLDNFTLQNQFTTKIIETTVDKKPQCSTCPLRLYCGGGCLYNNYYYNGDIFTPFPTYCNYMRALFKWGVWLYSNIDKAWLNKILLISPSEGEGEGGNSYDPEKNRGR